MGRRGAIIVVILVFAGFLLACATTRERGATPASPAPSAPARTWTPAPTPALTPAQPSPVSPAPAPVAEIAHVTTAKALGVLDHEPMMGILLARAPRVTLTIEAPTRLEAPGLSVAVPAGTITVEGRAGGWLLVGDTRLVTGLGTLRNGAGAGRPGFAIDAIPAFGRGERLRLTGEVVINAARGEVEVIERLPMETYLAAVVAKEMNPKWPAHALAAQAITARSYAAARWVERAHAPWQIHWHFGVDMAYPGWRNDLAPVAAAIAPTRGEVLMYRGLPVLALFHASSGGRTEAFEVIKPGVLGADGVTPIAHGMPVVDDPAALPGAAGLGLSASHGQWKTDLALPDVTKALQAWTTKARGRPTFGTIEGVSVQDRHLASGRVKTVSIRHVIDGKARFTSMTATDFRMAVSPVTIRSTWWDRCVIAARPPGYLVLEGRGFGHGCGLSQVSAWYLARQGESPEAIVQRFYAGSRIERRY